MLPSAWWSQRRLHLTDEPPRCRGHPQIIPGSPPDAPQTLGGDGFVRWDHGGCRRRRPPSENNAANRDHRHQGDVFPAVPRCQPPRAGYRPFRVRRNSNGPRRASIMARTAGGNALCARQRLQCRHRPACVCRRREDFAIGESGRPAENSSRSALTPAPAWARSTPVRGTACCPARCRHVSINARHG